MNFICEFCKEKFHLLKEKELRCPKCGEDFFIKKINQKNIDYFDNIENNYIDEIEFPDKISD